MILDIKFSYIDQKQVHKRLPKEEKIAITQAVFNKIGKHYFDIPPLGKHKIRIDNSIIHHRFKKNTPTSPNKYPFNINSNSLDADFELLICGDENTWYLLPTSCMKQVYDLSTKYIDKSHRNMAIYTIDTSTDKIACARKGMKASLSEFKNCILNEGRLLLPYTT